jgi:hypothetical protein
MRLRTLGWWVLERHYWVGTARTAERAPQHRDNTMDLERMLKKCHKQQWQVDQLDWSAKPRSMPPEEELRIVQFFTDMASVELFAAALFEHQCRVAPEPTLQRIFATFVEDERRHSEVARRLALHYDVHRLRVYAPSPELTRFTKHFLNAVRYLSPDIATAFITAGEILLDVALLRSLNDYVRDDMSQRAMNLVNRDEARHIAMDYHMVEFYATRPRSSWAARQPKTGLSHKLRSAGAFLGVVGAFGPVLEKVYFAPMALMDPSGGRSREAAKRIQLLRNRKGAADLPLAKFMSVLDAVNNHALLGRLSGRLARRLSGAFPIDLAKRLYTADELARANEMPIDDMANEVLALTRASTEALLAEPASAH